MPPQQAHGGEFGDFIVLPRMFGPGYRRRYSDLLRNGVLGDRIPVGTIFSAPVQTDPGKHTNSCAIGTDSLSQGKTDGAWP
jgi:hypothetical protein